MLEKLSNRILEELFASEKDFWTLLEKINVPLKDFISVMKTLKEKGFIESKDSSFALTEHGRRCVVGKDMGFFVDICKGCQGKRIKIDGEFNRILQEYMKILENRPPPSPKFFQSHILARDVIARAGLMHYYQDISGKSILLIGDDDLLCIVLGLMGLADRIVVMDIDLRLCEFIEKINSQYRLSIEFVPYDVREPIKSNMIRSFDVFSSEPLETISGLKAFAMRGISSLKENGVGYFGVTMYEAGLKKWRFIQALLLKYGCVLTDIIQGFSIYSMRYDTIDYEEFAGRLGLDVQRNKGINWYKSALLRFEVIDQKKASKIKNDILRVQMVDKKEDLTHPLTWNKKQ